MEPTSNKVCRVCGKEIVKQDGGLWSGWIHLEPTGVINFHWATP